jgi:hypothetical protein
VDAGFLVQGLPLLGASLWVAGEAHVGTDTKKAAWFTGGLIKSVLGLPRPFHRLEANFLRSSANAAAHTPARAYALLVPAVPDGDGRFNPGQTNNAGALKRPALLSPSLPGLRLLLA